MARERVRTEKEKMRSEEKAADMRQGQCSAASFQGQSLQSREKLLFTLVPGLLCEKPNMFELRSYFLGLTC